MSLDTFAPCDRYLSKAFDHESVLHEIYSGSVRYEFS